MNQLIKITEERREEFEEKFAPNKIWVVPSDDNKKDIQDIKSHITETLLAIVNAEIEKIEKNFPEKECCQIEAQSFLTHLKEYRDYLNKRL